jgi:hypothetical protein
MKENPPVETEVNTVMEKLTNLQALLQDIVPSFRIYATADHGMLWRMSVGDELKEIDGDWKHYMRRCTDEILPDSDLDKEYGMKDSWGGKDYLRLYYPYLFSSLASNEPGTHGGFSYQESVVPLIELN